VSAWAITQYTLSISRPLRQTRTGDGECRREACRDADANAATRFHRIAGALFQLPRAGGSGNGAGEPSIGVNPATGKVFFQSNTQTLRVTFDDTSSPARTTWERQERAECRHEP